MWLSDISPLRAGTVGSLSDNNLAEINVPIFASSVNRFLTFSSKRTIFGVFYSFPVHNFVISTKNKLPLAVYFPVSYTEIGAGIYRKKSKSFSKGDDVALIFNRLQFIKLSDNAVAGPKIVCIPCKRQRSAALRPPKKGRTACSFQPSEPESTQFLFRYRNASSNTARYPNTSGALRIPVRNTSEHLRRFPDLVRMPLRGPIYKERK